MNYRSREILSKILNQQSLCTVKELATGFEVSVRTIQNDIKDINDFLKKNDCGSLEFGEKGTVTTELLKNISQIRSLQENKNLYDDKLSKEERLSVLSLILATSFKYITIAQMAEMTFVSKATVVKDIEAVKERLKEHGIQVVAHTNKGFMSKGKESDIRKFLWSEQKTNVIIHFMEELFPNFKAIKIKRKGIIQKIVEEQEHVHGYYLTDSSYQKLVLYIQIMIWRIIEGCSMETLDASDRKFMGFAEDLVRYTAQYCSIITSDNESTFLGKVLESLRYLRIKEQNQEIVHIQIVTRRFIEKVSQELNEDLEVDYDLFESLFNHLASVFQSEKVSFPQDSIFYEIANENPFVFQVVSNNQHILEEFAKRELSEVETIYITIHICAALERKKKQGTNIRVVLVCHGGIGSSQLLAAKLRNSFAIQIVDIISVHELQYIKRDYADLIISTIPLENPSIEYVQTSILLEEKDFFAIKEKMEQIKKNYNRDGIKAENSEMALINKLKSIIYTYEFEENGKAARQIENEVLKFFHKDMAYGDQAFTPYLHQLLTPDFIQLDISCKDWQDAVRKSAKRLLDRGYIEKDYVDAMISNVVENGPYIIISPGFALPHADLDAGTYKTGMNFIRLKEPVEFGENPTTRAEFVCCLCAVDYKTHVKALINLVNMLANERFKKELRKASNPANAAAIIRKYEYTLEENIM